MGDFDYKSNFPIGTVIDAAQRKAELEQNSRLQSQQQLLSGLNAVGQIGQNLFDRKRQIAQSLALGRTLGIPDDQAATMLPEQVLQAGTQKVAEHKIAATAAAQQVNMAGLMLGLHPELANNPNFMAAFSGTGANQQPSSPAMPVNGAPQTSGAQLISTDTGSSQSSPSPQSPTPPPTVNKATANAMMRLGLAQRSVPVMTVSDALHQGTVPKGARIIGETQTGGFKNYIGNDQDGNPLFADKAGNITRGAVPAPSLSPGGQPAVSPGGPVLPKNSTMPTASTRSSAEFANTLLPHIDYMRNLIQQADAAGYIGPGAGRVYGQFLAGKVGTTGDPAADKLLGDLRATDSLLKTGAMRVHFGARGGQQMYDHFSDMLNSGKQSAAMLNGSLNGIQNFMEGYAAAGRPGAGRQPLSVPGAGTDIHDQALDWANSHPNDPRAQAIIQKATAAKGQTIGL